MKKTALVLEELGLEHPQVIAIAKQVAANQVAKYKAGDRSQRLLGDYRRVFSEPDFVAPMWVDEAIVDVSMHDKYLSLVDKFRKELFAAERKKIKKS